MAAAPVKIRVKDVLGVKAAEFDLTGIVLVGGRNGAGKTSLLQATAATLLRQWPMRGVQRKVGADVLVRDGVEIGSAIAQWSGGACRIVWGRGGAEVDEKGTPLNPPPIPLALGTTAFMSLAPETRKASVQEIWEAEPTRDDLAAWCRENQKAGIDPDAKDDDDLSPFDVLWADLQEQGWTAMERRWSAEATRLTGAWGEVTGTRWGATKRNTWAPPGLFAEEVYSIEEAGQALLQARGALADMRLGRMRDAGRLEALTLEGNQAGQYQADLAALKLAASERLAAYELLLVEHNKTTRPQDPRLDITCPHCGQGLKARRGGEGGGLIIEKMSHRMGLREYEAALLEYEAIVRRVAIAQEAVEADRAQIVLLTDRVRRAAEAAREAEAIRALPEVDEAGERAAMEAVTTAESHLANVKKHARAYELSREWEQAKLIADMLGTDGLCATVMARKIAEINGALGAISQQAKTGSVAITDAADLTYDGRPYTLASESERWRCDFVMARCIGQKLGIFYQIVDRFDVIEPQSRPGILSALHQRGVAALVGMTARDYAAVPDVAGHGLGRTYWMDAGMLQAVASTKAT
jgi:hypothetical protein